jgi:hypothetical protein
MCTEYPFHLSFIDMDGTHTVPLHILFVLTMTYGHIDLFNPGLVMSRNIPAL